MSPMELLDRGWFPIPLQGKLPVGKWRDYTREQIQKIVWKGNWGLDVRKSELVVGDADTKEAEEYFLSVADRPGIVVETPSCGKHFYYRALKDVALNSRYNVNKLGLDIIVNGYVVAWDSFGSNGRQYTLLRDEELTEWNDEWIPKEEPYIPKVVVSDADVEWRRKKALDQALEVFSISGRGGDRTLFTVACAFIQYWQLPYEVALETLRVWNETNAKPSWEESRLIYRLREAERLKQR